LLEFEVSVPGSHIALETVTLWLQGTKSWVRKALDTDMQLFFSLPYFGVLSLISVFLCFPFAQALPSSYRHLNLGGAEDSTLFSDYNNSCML